VVVVQEGYAGGDGGVAICDPNFSGCVSAPKRNALLFERAYCTRHGALSHGARERSINDRAMNAQIAVDRVRRAIPRKIDHFSGNPGAPRRVAPRDSFRLRSGFGPVSAGGGRRLRRVFPSFFHHPRDKARLVPDLRAADQYLADATPRNSLARARARARARTRTPGTQAQYLSNRS